MLTCKGENKMRFYTVQKEQNYLPVVSFDGGKTGYDVRQFGMEVQSITELIRTNSEENRKCLENAAKTADDAKSMDLSEVKICAPIIHPDQDMICLGINYSEHSVEAARFSEDAFGGARPYTIYFSKRVNYASGTGDPIPAYEGIVDGLDYEVELGVILGKNVKNITAEEAKDSIFGYTIINDVSARNLQTRHKQWYRGKSLDGFASMGPCIVTADEVGDPENLNIKSEINGELRQNSNTGYMVQTVANAIAELSEGMTLKAGTIIATGTPSGVGMGFNPPRFLKKGDKIACHIEKIGELINYVE